MANTMKTSEKNEMVRNNTVEILGVAHGVNGVVQYGNASYAVPVMVDGVQRWGKVVVTAGAEKATKTTAAFDPMAVRNEWLAKLAESERKAQEKAEAKAAKVKADAAKRAKANSAE